MANIVRIFIASPSDVETERNHVADVAAGLNRNMAAERDVRFDVVGYNTDVRPRVDERGVQGVIDEDLPLEQFHIVVGILWKRLGPGTEHEIRSAIKCGKPEVVICFNDALYKPKDVPVSRRTRITRKRAGRGPGLCEFRSRRGRRTSRERSGVRKSARPYS